MPPVMNFEVRILRRLIPANVTSVRLFPRMRHFMLSQLSRSGAFKIANAANIWCFSSVNTHVLFKIGVLRGFKVANLTREGFYAGMYKEVLL